MLSDRFRSAVILTTLQVAFFTWTIVFGRFIATDEIAYKAAGREWAKSGAFTSPELIGYGPWHDQAHPLEQRGGFAPYLYTFAFGLFVKVFSFNPVTTVAFDVLIHVLLGWATWALARALGPDLPYEVAMIAAAATLPTGTAGRPDELGTMLAMFGAAILLRRITVGRAVAAGALFALSGATSAVAGIILMGMPIRAFLLQREARWRSIAAFLFSGGLLFTMVMLPVLSFRFGPVWHAANESVRANYQWAIGNSLRYGKPHYLASCAALVIAAAHALHAYRKGSWKTWVEIWTPLLAALGLLLIFLPVKYYYIGIVNPSLFAAAACAVALLQWRPAARAAIVTLAVVFWCAASSRFFFMSLVRATLPHDQQMAANVALLHRMIPAGSGVMTYDFWPALAGSSYRTYSTEANPPWSDVDYIVLTGNGSGTPGQPQALLPEQLSYVNGHYSPIYNNLNRQPFRLGPIHTNSAWGYGPLILKRNDASR